MKTIHAALTGLSITIILLSLNRLTSATQGYLAPFDFLRWLDFNAMLPISLLSIIFYWILKRQITYYNDPFRKTRLYTLLTILLVSGIYFFGAGSGDHEITNYLNTRFCGAGVVQSDICKIISFNDDEFSHVVYYAGFILINITLILLEYRLPRKTNISNKDMGIITANSLFIALGIFANLAFEEAGLDLVFFGSVMILSLLLLWKKRHVKKLPVTFYFALSYTIGVVGTFLYKGITGTPL